MRTMTEYEEKFEQNGAYRRVYKTLVARDGERFLFLDDTFAYGGPDALYGATGYVAVPVREEEYERRVENVKDYEHSPLRHIYEEEAPRESWDEWIAAVPEYDIRELAYESAPSAVWDAVMGRIKAEPEWDRSEIHGVELISCGRLSDRFRGEHDIIYDQEALAAAIDAEERPIGH